MTEMKRFIILTAIVVLAGCRQGTEKEQAISPEQTVEAFCRAVASGDMSQAQSLCDTVAMEGYLQKWAEKWAALERKDSSALKIASGILSNAGIKVQKTERDGDKRVIIYTLEVDGKTKTRSAVVRKEEGAWRVENITDAV